MKLKLKIMGKKLLTIMISCLMLLGTASMMTRVSAENQERNVRATHNDVITDIKLTESDLTTPAGWANETRQMQLVAKFSLPNNTVHAGDTTVIPVPKELEIFKKETFPIKNEKGDVIANAVTDPDTKTITMTYTNFVDTHSDITGSLHVTVKIDTKVVTEPKTLHLKISMGPFGPTFDLGKLNYTGVQGDSPDEVINKWSWFDKDDPTIVHCRIRVNAKSGNFPYIKVKDTIESSSVSYVKESVKVKKGKWKLPAGGGYYSLENEVDVTGQFPLTYSGNSFTVQFNNVRGEGYLIKYDVKLAYAPVNQEVISNRIVGETQDQVLINTVVEARYQQSGGEANGYNFTIKIHKESEDGHKLKGAIFEVIRDSSQAKVGEITTDNDGKGSLSGLLKDNYTIKEKKAPEGYMPLDSDIHVKPDDFGTDKAVLKTIKNKKIPKVDICGEKTWDDENDQDGKRPKEITVNLLANGQPIQNTDVKADPTGKWKYSFKDLPKYDDEGKEITYTVTEDVVAEYTPEINGHNIKNSYTPKKTSATVTKKWDDGNDQDGKRPNSIKVQLYGNDEKVGDEVELTEGNWSYTWNDLPEKKEGKVIKYTVKEVGEIKGYTTSYNNENQGNMIICNKHVPEKTGVEGKKTWNDGDDQDGKRPREITVNLLANGIEIKKVKATAANNWAYSFTDLPKYENGQEIKYTVTEDAVGGYTPGVDGFDIKNSYTPEETSVTVTKGWNDGSNQDGKRPKSIKVQLYANDEKKGAEVELSDGNGWTHTWTKLPKKAKGKDIKYTVKETTKIDGYSTIVDNSNTGNIKILNSHTPETTEIKGKKTWNDEDDRDGTRPKEITVNLLSNGKKVKEIKTTSANNWAYSFTNLPKYENGKEVQYTVTENTVEGYNTEIRGYDIKNNYTPKKTSVTVTKRWNDSNDRDRMRPASIKVQLYGNGEKKGEAVELEADSKWSHTWNNLPQKDKGKDVKYTVKEAGRPSGYTVNIDDKNHGNIIITNTHTPKDITKPDTGDKNRLIPYIAMFILSAVALIGMLITRKRKGA